MKLRSEVFNDSYKVGLKQYPDKFFDLAICDPPYFNGPNKLGYYGGRKSRVGVYRGDYNKTEYWEVPGYDFYNELVRVSKHQIIWGINYFVFAGEVSGRIVWDKCNGGSSFSDCEIASCSLIDSVRMFRYMWNGMMQGKSVSAGHIMQGNKKLNEKRIHPTQKPVALYDWTFSKFANRGQTVIDTHVGSGSSRISAFKAGIDYVGYEIDPAAWALQEKRFTEFTAQLSLELNFQ